MNRNASSSKPGVAPRRSLPSISTNPLPASTSLRGRQSMTPRSSLGPLNIPPSRRQLSNPKQSSNLAPPKVSRTPLRSPEDLNAAPTTMAEWAEGVSGALSPPSEVSELENQSTQRGMSGDMVEHESWELRTETVGYTEDYEDPDVASIQANYARQLNHYKNLLVRAQSASSSSIHELHSQLYELETRHAALQAEHAKCTERNIVSERQASIHGNTHEAIKSGQGLSALVRGFGRKERIELLGTIAEACQPSDIDAQIALLETYKRSKLDILGRLEDHLAARILSHLTVTDILQARLVCRRWAYLTRSPELWKRYCRRLEWRNWDGENGLEHLKNVQDNEWEPLYKVLQGRERNWNTGRARQVFLLQGHSNYVTSLKLRGDTLISGSYDETIRIWRLPSLHRSVSPIPKPTKLPAKAVSCLDYYPPAEVLVAGTHDVGRVQVWRRKGLEWDLVHTLSGHLHGIRAVAINDRWLVSAGADKALVVWNWQTGDRVVRFGQQTNICVGIQLIEDYVVAVTVDGVIRTFSIRKRDIVSQYKVAELGKQADLATRARLKDVGGGTGGMGMITWFQAQGKSMTCATRDLIIRVEWEEIEEEVQPDVQALEPVSPAHTPASRVRTTSSASRALPALQTPVRQRTTSMLSNKNSTPSLKSSNCLEMSTPSPVRGKTMMNTQTLSPTPTSLSTPRKALSASRRSTLGPDIAEEPVSTSPLSNDVLRRIVPAFCQTPRLVEVITTPELERGSIDARRSRIVTSTRFAARAGADRQVYLGTTAPESEQTSLIPIKGVWADKADELNLRTPEKNPMSLVLDRDKLVYGCTDGTIVVVGFVGGRDE